MKKHVKLLSLLFAVLMAVSIFAACGKDTEQGNDIEATEAVSAAQETAGNDSASEEVSTENAEPVTVEFLRGGDPNLAPSNDAVGEYVMEKFYEDTGEQIILEPVFVAYDVFKEKLYTMITAGSNPGLLDGAAGAGAEYWLKGYFQDITALAEEYAPAMYEVYSEDEIGYFRSKDGEQYGLPLGGRNVNYAFTLREDQMIKYGIDLSVETLDELEAAFDVYMANEPEGLAVATAKSRWYIMLTALAGMEGQPTDKVEVDGKLVPAYLSDEMVNFLTIAKRWYEKGYVSSDIFTIGSSDAEKIFESGNSFCVIDYADMAVRWRFGKRLNTIDASAVPFTVGPIETPYDSGHLLGDTPSSSGALHVFINCDEQVAEMAVKYYNWEISDAANWLTTHFGIEGENYYIDENGKMGYPESWSAEGADENYSGYWQFAGEPPMHAGFMPENVDDLPQFIPSQQMLASADVIVNPIAINCPYFPIDDYSTDYSAALEELEVLAAEIIVGKQPLEAWDNAQAMWQAAGGDALSDALTEVYNEYRRD